MLEWLAAIAVFVLLLALLPILLRRTKPTRSKGGGSGVMIGIGLVFSMIFDPRVAAATELIDRKKDEREDEESGDKA
jgi:hypothetical protein